MYRRLRNPAPGHRIRSTALPAQGERQTGWLRLPSSSGIAPVNWLLYRVQEPQAGEVAQLLRDRPRQLVVVQVQDLQAGEVAQLLRDLPRQLVVVQVQDAAGWRGCPAPPGSPPSTGCCPGPGSLQAGEVAQLLRDRPRSTGCCPGTGSLQAGEVAQLLRDRPRSTGCCPGTGAAGWRGCPAPPGLSRVNWLEYR